MDKILVEFTQKEINDLYYCVEMFNRSECGKLITKDEVNALSEKVGNAVYELAKKQN
jgi:hypothetical protein